MVYNYKRVRKHSVSIWNDAITHRLKPPPNPHQTPTYAKPHRLDFKYFKTIINVLKCCIFLFLLIINNYITIINAPVGVEGV